MTKREFIKLTAKTNNLSEAKAREIINGIIDNIKQALEHGDEIKLDGLGKFYVMEYKGRTLTTPQGETRIILDHNTPKFKASDKLKQALR